jgi:transposase InsO family protein
MVPPNLVDDILYSFHYDKLLGAHQGVDRIVDLISTRFWWSSIRKDVLQHRRKCLLCQLRHPKYKDMPPLTGDLMNMPMHGPWHTIAVDILTNLPRTFSGNEHIVVFTDTFSKWTEAFAVTSHNAETVAELLTQEIVCRFGAPVRLLSDRGSDFTAAIVRQTCKLLEVNKIFTTAYHPSTNGQVERFNKTLANLLSSFTNQENNDWDVYLPFVMFAYRNAVHSSTGYSPYYMLFARDPYLPMDSLVSPTALDFPDPEPYVVELRTKFLRAYEHAKKNIDLAQARQKRAFDLRHPRIPTFKPGDRVLKYTPGGKFDLSWNGPYTVVGPSGKKHFLIRSEDGASFNVNANALKLFIEPNALPANQFLTEISGLPHDQFPFVPEPALKSSAALPPVTPTGSATPVTTTDPHATSTTEMLPHDLATFESRISDVSQLLQNDISHDIDNNSTHPVSDTTFSDVGGEAMSSPSSMTATRHAVAHATRETASYPNPSRQEPTYQPILQRNQKR